jgi:uncharacterized protein YwqG
MSDNIDWIAFIKKVAKPKFQEVLIEASQPAIQFKTVKKTGMQLGKTKLGGLPHLPQGMGWLRNENGAPYNFLAQVNLSEVAPFDVEQRLPSKGMLYFFFNLFHLEDGRVIYSESEELEIVEPPKDLTRERKNLFQRWFNLDGKIESGLIKVGGVEISTEYTLPDLGSSYFEKMKLEHGLNHYTDLFQSELLEEEVFEAKDSNDGNHHLLGHYQSVQLNPLEPQFTSLEEVSKKEKLEQSLAWQLLFQFDSDSLLDFNFIDAGRIYFFIHQDDLAKQYFDNVLVATDFC